MKQDIPQVGDEPVRNAHLVCRRAGQRRQELDNLLHLIVSNWSKCSVQSISSHPGDRFGIER